MQKLVKSIAKQTGIENSNNLASSYSRATDTLKKELVYALGNQMSSGSPGKQSTPSTFKQRRYRKYIFRNQRASDELGIILFLSAKPSSQESFERLIHAIFRKSYPNIRKPQILYFDANNKVVQMEKIKQNTYTYIYITESDIENPFESSPKNSPHSKVIGSFNQSQPSIKQKKAPTPAPLEPNPLETHANNLDLFVIRESLYNDYLSGRLDLENIEDSYAELQFFLEQCSQDIWNRLEDFANVQYNRRTDLADIVEGLDQKKLEVLEVKEVLMDVLADFEEQECLVRSIFAQLGFDENFIESTSIMTQQSHNKSQSQQYLRTSATATSFEQSRFPQSQSMAQSQQRWQQQSQSQFIPNESTNYAQTSFSQVRQSQGNQMRSIENQLQSFQFEDKEEYMNKTELFDFLPKNAREV